MKTQILLLIGCLTAASCSQKLSPLPVYSPIPTKRVMPEYPEILKRAGFEAVVQLSALVDEVGNVGEVKIIKSVPIVDSVCVVAVRKWRFEPGKIADASGNYRATKFWVPIFFDWSGLGQ